MTWLKQLFCKHDYKPSVKVSKFQNLRRERVYYYICTKCEHEKEPVFQFSVNIHKEETES